MQDLPDPEAEVVLPDQTEVAPQVLTNQEEAPQDHVHLEVAPPDHTNPEVTRQDQTDPEVALQDHMDPEVAPTDLAHLLDQGLDLVVDLVVLLAVQEIPNQE
jgi:hypothetical protein